METKTFKPDKLAIFLLIALALGLAIALGGCKSAQSPQPQAVTQPGQDFGAQLARGYMVNAQVRSTTAKILKAKQIDAEGAKRVLAITDLARAGLDQARALYFNNQLKELANALAKVERLHLDAQLERDGAEQALKGKP